ncbi:MAG TPA: trypsin-like peptidase domain-containing protein [Longimicrobiales bacterium]|nr:trypsin-like peptidase domain-containing protein [Longimicrobiales bacterium]
MQKVRYWLTSGLLLLAASGCDEAGRAVSDAFGQRTVPQDAPDRVHQQLGDIPTVLDTTAAAQLSSAFRAAAALALPAVVQITTVAVNEIPQQALPFHPEGIEQRTQGTGSGFIFDERGYILTNYHVVRNALHVNVVMLDGREYTADVIGSDPDTDVAVLRIEPARGEQLPVIQLGDSDGLRVGEWVIALGNPLGLTFTTTAGIVSAKGRAIGILAQSSDTPLEAFIQTDAAINPGNSGGPLVDLNGRVIGINTAIQSPTGLNAGAGFAIPIALAKKVADDIVAYGVVHRPRLGVTIEDVNAADAEVYSLPSITGAEVTSVQPGTPADRAGLQLGDVIVTIEDRPVHTVSELQARVARFQPGDRIRVGYIRYGREGEATVELGEFDNVQPRPVAQREDRERNPLGFNVQPLPAQMASRLGLRGDNIPVVSRVDPLGPASRSSLRPGMVIRQFNGREVGTIRDLERYASSVRSGAVVSLIVLPPSNGESIPMIVNYRAQ